MTDNASYVQTVAELAWQRLQDDGYEPTPENYELWYMYYGKTNKGLIAAIDQETEKTGGKLDPAAAHTIFGKYISDFRTNDRIIAAGDQMSEALQVITQTVEGAKDLTQNFNVSLNKAKTNLGNVNDTGDLSTILQDVTSETDSVLEKNKKLEAELTAAAERMASLQNDLDTARRDAMTDALTGVHNRKAFDRELSLQTKAHQQQATSMTLLMIDIDHFKKFNDTYGHQVGDQVIKLVARTLREGVKGKDFVARYGGEEFSVILPETNLLAATVLGNQLIKAVSAKEIINRSTGEFLSRITISVGVAELGGTETGDQVVARADEALYNAKRNGRNQLATAQPPSRPKGKAAG
jgi:diguanylate cyclase